MIRKRTVSTAGIGVGILTALAGLAAFVPLQASADDPIQVGAPIPLTGPLASDGEVMRQGIRLAVQDLNERGGLLGRELEITEYDIGDLTPDKLQSAASNLIERRNVDVLINGYGAMGPDIPAFCPYDQPYIHNAATPNVTDMMERMNCSNIFMATDLGGAFGRIAFDQMRDMGHDFDSNRIVILHGPYDWEVDKAEGIAVSAREAGWEVAMTEEVSYGTSEWGGILSRIRGHDPALVVIELLDPDAVWRFVSQLRDDPPANALVYTGYTGSMPAFGEFASGGDADGVLGMTLSAHDPDSQEGQAFMESWREAYGEDPPYSIAAQIYDHVMIWANAVEEVGDVRDFDAINRTIHESEYEGLTGSFAFNEYRYVYAGSDLPPYLLQIQDSEVRMLMRNAEQLRDAVGSSWLD